MSFSNAFNQGPKKEEENVSGYGKCTILRLRLRERERGFIFWNGRLWFIVKIMPRPRTGNPSHVNLMVDYLDKMSVKEATAEEETTSSIESLRSLITSEFAKITVDFKDFKK